MLNVNIIVTKDLVDDVFGAIISKHGGWKPSLMPLYIDMVIEKINNTTYDSLELRKAVIKRMKELDPILFKRIL